MSYRLHRRAISGLEHPLLLALAAACWLSATGCKENVYNVRVEESPDFVVRGVIGQQGGSLRVIDPSNPAFGTEVTIPPGAVSRDTEMTIQPGNGQQAAPFGVRSVGVAVLINFPSITRTARVRLPFVIDPLRGEELAALRLGNAGPRPRQAAGGGDGDWTQLPASLVDDNTRRIELDTQGFGLFVPVAISQGQVPDGGTGDGGPGSDGGMLPPPGRDRQPPIFAGLEKVQLLEGNRRARLAWNPATDDRSASSAIRYRLYLPSFGTLGVPQGESVPGATSLELPVTPGVSYYFIVRAVDEAGNEDSNLRVQTLEVPAQPVKAGQLGAPCKAAGECESGFCADGVCCDSACTNGCNLCNAPGRAGTCTPAAAGTDPRNACTSADPDRRFLCDGEGSCNYCRPANSEELCNNGVDDDGDQLADREDPDCVVCFDQPTSYVVEVQKTGTGSGTVVSQPAGIDCGEACAASFPAKAEVTLTATADPDSDFVGWAGACAGQTGDSCTVSVTEALTAVAAFALRPPPVFEVEVAVEGQGTVSDDMGSLTCDAAGSPCSANYEQGTHVTLTATPAAGHYFLGWSGACRGTGSCVLSVDSAKSVTARFAPIIHLVTVVVDGDGSGTVTDGSGAISCGTGGMSCASNFPMGSTVTLTARPGLHSVFTGWSGACTGTGSCEIEVASPTIVIANFAPITHTVTVGTAGTGAGTVTNRSGALNCGVTGDVCAVDFPEGMQVTLIANPAPGSFFSRWTGDCSGTSRTCTLSVDGPRNATAIFLPVTHSLAVSLLGTGTGRVVDDLGRIDCHANGGTCTADYDEGTQLTLTATPSPNHRFVGWEGACSGIDPCTLAIDVARNVSARFEPITHVVSVTVSGSGTGTVTDSLGRISCGAGGSTCTATYNQGTEVTLTASPGTASSFAGWSGACQGTGPCTFTVTGATQVGAMFVPRTHNVSVALAGTGSGQVTDNTGTIVCGQGQSACSGTFTEGTQLTFTATPGQGSFLFGWLGACTGTGPCTVTVSGATSVTARFEPQVRTLTVTPAIGGEVFDDQKQLFCFGGKGPCSEDYPFGTVVTLSAQPQSGFAFDGWGGACSGTGSCVVTMDANRSVTASFRAVFHTLNVSVTGGGTVRDNTQSINCNSDGGNCSAQYQEGTQVTLTATPLRGFAFSGWQGACQGTGPCTVTMDASRTVSATFTPLATFNLTVRLTGQGAGSVTGGNGAVNCTQGTCTVSFFDGDVITLTGTPAQGSFFEGFSGACTGTSPCTLTMNQDRTVSASFQPNNVTLSVGVSAGGSVSGPGIACVQAVASVPDCTETYPFGQQVTLTANTQQGFAFVGWGDACASAGSNTTCTLTLTANTTVSAQWRPLQSFTLNLGVAGGGSGAILDASGAVLCATGQQGCAPTFLEGTTVVLNASAGRGSFFFGWGAGDCSGNGTCTLLMDRNRSATAIFQPSTVSLTININDPLAGYVVDADGTECSKGQSSCVFTYSFGSQVTLSAELYEADYRFAGWSGDCSGTGDCNLTMTQNRTITANFEEDVQTLTVIIGGSDIIGQVNDDLESLFCDESLSPCTQEYPTGEEVTLYAYPGASFAFLGWSGPCASGQAFNECVVTLSQARTVTANFGDGVPLTTVITGNGFVFDDYSSLFCGSGTCVAEYAPNLQVTLTASPGFNQVFAGWGGDGASCGTSPTCTVTMAQARRVTALFQPVTVTLSVTVRNDPQFTLPGIGTVTDNTGAINCSVGQSCGATYPIGTQVILDATPGQLTNFTRWEGACFSFGSGTRCLLNLNSSMSTTANFTGVIG